MKNIEPKNRMKLYLFFRVYGQKTQEASDELPRGSKSLARALKKFKRLPRDHFLMAGGAAKTAVVRGFTTQNLGGVMSST